MRTSLQPLGDELSVLVSASMTHGAITIDGVEIDGVEVPASAFSPAQLAAWRYAIVAEIEDDERAELEAAAEDFAWLSEPTA